jgi:SAM-dependent methyltransferase
LLDVGVGPGTITVDLAALLTEGTAVGIDNAPAAIDAARRLADERDVANITLEQGDVYHLRFDSGSFDIVHAHQVLQHLGDPVAALREMGRVCARDGVVAARDADYAAMTWFPESSALSRWLDLYRAIARANGGEPDAGRRLKAWALAAGFTDVTASASAWCFASPEDLAWWSDTWAERLVKSDFGQQAVARGRSNVVELRGLADGWRAWARRDGAWFSVLHGEVLCTGHPQSAPIDP